MAFCPRSHQSNGQSLTWLTFCPAQLKEATVVEAMQMLKKKTPSIIQKVKHCSGTRQTGSCFEQTSTHLIKVRKNTDIFVLQYANGPEAVQISLFENPLYILTFHWPLESSFPFVKARAHRQSRSSHCELYINTDFMSNYYNNEKAIVTITLLHPAARECLIHNTRKEGLSIQCQQLLESGNDCSLFSVTTCWTFMSETHEGLEMSLLPNRTVFQEDRIQTSNFLAVGSCHLGGHPKLLKATPASLTLTAEPWQTELTQSRVCFSLGMEEMD